MKRGTWHCGDCGAEWPLSVEYCWRPLDDYLSLRGGSMESAMRLAVDRVVEPMVRAALRRLAPPKPKPVVYQWTWHSAYKGRIRGTGVPS